MASFGFTVNGSQVSVTCDGDRPLLEVLREDLGLTGTKYGCGEGSCRSCTVFIGERPIASCQTPVSDAEGETITTIEGYTPGDGLRPLQEAFIKANAMQCGYCVPGMILTAEALLRTNPDPTRAEIATWMNGNICRCCNYVNILTAIEEAAGAMRKVGS